MASVTPHLNLVKLEMTDKIDVSIPNLAQNATKIDDAVKDLEDQSSTLREDVDKNSSTIDKNKDEIALNQVNISKNAENISQINQDLGEVRANMDALNERASELNEVAETNKSTIELIQTQLIDFEERLSALEPEQPEESEGEEE